MGSFSPAAGRRPELPACEIPGTPLAFRRLLSPLVIGLALCAVVYLIDRVHQAHGRTYNFGVFYCSASMVWDSARGSLYNLAAQRAFQAHCGRSSISLFYYPAFALAPFLPLAALPARVAFLVWTAVSLGLLAVSVRSLSRLCGSADAKWVFALSLTFLPIVADLVHGQLSLVTLAGFVWCYSSWRDGRRFAGGMALALACFKFQLVAGFVLILLLKKKWRELTGLSLASIPLALASIAIAGLRGFLGYFPFVFAAEAGSDANPPVMACWRGLIRVLLPGGSHLALIAILSLAAVMFAAWLWTDLDVGFSAAILASLLTAYHSNPQDLSLAVIPFFLLTRGISVEKRLWLAIAGISFTTGIYLSSFQSSFLAIPLAAILLGIAFRTKMTALLSEYTCFHPGSSRMTRAIAVSRASRQNAIRYLSRSRFGSSSTEVHRK